MEEGVSYGFICHSIGIITFTSLQHRVASVFQLPSAGHVTNYTAQYGTVPPVLCVMYMSCRALLDTPTTNPHRLSHAHGRVSHSQDPAQKKQRKRPKRPSERGARQNRPGKGKGADGCCGVADPLSPIPLTSRHALIGLCILS